MYIRSRVQEVERTFFEVDLQDQLNVLGQFNRKAENLKSKFLVGELLAFFTDGLCILKNSYDVHKTCIDLVDVKEDYIQLSLLATGKSNLIKKDTGKRKEIPVGIVQLAYRNQINARVEMPVTEEQLNYYRVFLSRSYYLSLMAREPWCKSDMFYQQVEQKRHVFFGQIVVPASFNIVGIIDKIMHHTYEGELGQYYVQTKLKELFLTIQMQKSASGISATFDSVELDKLELAKNHLESNYRQPPTIKQLSKIVTLNEYKLKHGFKGIYKSSIRSYIIDLRMQQARKMLDENYSIGEISYAVGYKSVSHFIMTYDKTFGETPKQSIRKLK